MLVGLLACGMVVGALFGAVALLGGVSPLVALAIYGGVGALTVLALLSANLAVEFLRAQRGASGGGRSAARPMLVGAERPAHSRHDPVGSSPS